MSEARASEAIERLTKWAEYYEEAAGKSQVFDEMSADLRVVLAENAEQAKQLADVTTNYCRVVRERDELAAFKSFVHRRLDEAGIPTHPDGPHSKEGCRIGDRLDIALAEGQGWRGILGEYEAKLAAAKAENERLTKIINHNNESTCQIAAKHKQAEAAKEAALAELQKWRTGVVDIENDLHRMRQLAKEARAVCDREYWSWQGDGTDYPESLVCPILIHPNAMRQILRERDASLAEVERLTGELTQAKQMLRDEQRLGEMIRKERDAALALVETLKSNRYRELLADACIERDAAVQAKEAAERRFCEATARNIKYLDTIDKLETERDAAVQAKGLEIKAAHDELRRLELRIADLVQARDIAAETAALAVQAKERAEREYEHHLLGCAALDKHLESIGLVDDSGDEQAGVWRNARAERAEAGAAVDRDRLRRSATRVLQRLEENKFDKYDVLDCQDILRAALAQQPDQRPTKER